jgi:hypothetical protein|tara:strand:- start:952 stop:1839 length:888 start_codon:yes stop_codon:yes gene_type:complete
MIKKNAVVRLKGGFGNQLFQIIFAHELTNNGIEVTVSTKNFKRATKKGATTNKDGINLQRNLTFPLEYFGLVETNNKTLYFYELAEKFLNFKILNYIFRFLNLKSFKEFNDRSIKKFELGKYNLFTGYWQDISNFINNKKFIIESISNNEEIKNSLGVKPVVGSTVLHIRRKDYVNMGEDLSIDFYKKALIYAENNIKNFNYTIFTDDPQWASEKDEFIHAEGIKSSTGNKDDTVETFSEMLKFENFIVGNSTFSLIPAILRETDLTKIIIANPWFKNSNPIENFPKQWIKINNE